MKRLKLGWLSTSGEFTECPFMEHHWASEQIAKKCGWKRLEYLNDSNYPRHPDDYLMSLGYVHITTSVFNHKYFILWDKFLTEEQKNFLRPYFEEPDLINELDLMRWKDEEDINEKL